MSRLTKYLVSLLVLAGVAWGQQRELDPANVMVIDFPADAPVRLVKADWGESEESSRGGVTELDLKSTIVLQNVSQQQIRGIVLKVAASEVTPGGRGSVAIPSLSVDPNEQFVVRVDLRLLSPPVRAGEALVKVTIEGVLYRDLRFFGPNEMNSKRMLMGWEMQASRDRERFRKTLAERGVNALKDEMVASLDRLADTPGRTARVNRRVRASNRAPEREMQVATLDFPGAPVDLLDGFVKVAGSELRHPQIGLRNKSDRRVSAVEVGLRLRDNQGKEYLAGLSTTEVALAPGQMRSVQTPEFLEFRQPSGAPLSIEWVEAFVSQVQFSDGRMWVPGANVLADGGLRNRLMPSPEEMRLADLYRRKGLEAVIKELQDLK